MKIARTALVTGIAAALAVPTLALSAPAASAATPSYRTCNVTPGPWEIHTQAVNIRSRASTSGVILGILYRGQKFSVHSYTSGETWVNITDLATGVRGWVSGTYVYREYPTCLT